MSRFGSDPHTFFDSVYKETPPWDIGGAQPALSALLTKYPPANPILDVGCGTGDLAISLAQSGQHVLGIDFVDAAIAQAREKVEALPPEVARLVEFEVADALHPSRLKRHSSCVRTRFGSVVDCAFFHLFDPKQCDDFIDEIVRVLLPGGRYYLLAFAIEFDIPNSPRQISEDELRSRFTPAKGWRILEVQSAELLSRFPPVPAICACIERI